MAQNIIKDLIQIDSKFAQIVGSLARNQYNPQQIYDIRARKNKQLRDSQNKDNPLIIRRDNQTLQDRIVQKQSMSLQPLQDTQKNKQLRDFQNKDNVRIVRADNQTLQDRIIQKQGVSTQQLQGTQKNKRLSQNIDKTSKNTLASNRKYQADNVGQAGIDPRRVQRFSKAVRDARLRGNNRLVQAFKNFQQGMQVKQQTPKSNYQPAQNGESLVASKYGLQSPESSNQYNALKDYDDKGLSTIYTGQSSVYVRLIKKSVLDQLSSKVQNNYQKIRIRQTALSLPPFDSLDNTPYRPIPLPLSLSDAQSMINGLRSNGISSLSNLLGGLRQYYFGYHLNVGRQLQNTQPSSNYRVNLGFFFLYNSLRGLINNITITPLSFTLGFGIPLLGRLQINGAFGLQSKYTQDGIDNQQLHSIPPAPGQKSGLKALQKVTLDPDFFSQLSAARAGLATKGTTRWKKATPPINRISDILTNLFGKALDRSIDLANQRKDKSPLQDTRHSVYGQMRQVDKYPKLTQYRKQIVQNRSKTRDFHKQIGIDSPNVVLLKIKHQQTDPSLSDIQQLILPATIKNISDNIGATWQDTWNNTGRFQPIKAFTSTTRNITVDFSVFAFAMFNDPNMVQVVRNQTQKTIINRTRQSLKKNNTRQIKSIVEDIILADDQYRQTVNWLAQLCYPKSVGNTIKRYNIQTFLTIGQYIKQKPVFVNSVSITPNSNFYWVNKFPMLVDISMSFTVFRQVDKFGNIVPGKLSYLNEASFYRSPAGIISQQINQQPVTEQQ